MIVLKTISDLGETRAFVFRGQQGNVWNIQVDKGAFVETNTLGHVLSKW